MATPYLVAYLDAIDERLPECLYADEEMRVDAVQPMRFYATALLDGSISPVAPVEDWPDWFHVAGVDLRYCPADRRISSDAAVTFRAGERASISMTGAGGTGPT